MAEFWQRKESSTQLTESAREDLAYWLEGRARNESPEVAAVLRGIVNEIRDGRMVAWSR